MREVGHYIIYRLVSLVFQLMGALALVFVLIQIIPYDPSVFFLINFRSNNPEAQQRLLEQLRASLGINVPVYVQYFRFLKGLFGQGSLGVSWTSGLPVELIILRAMKYTLVTFGIAFILYTPIAFIMGIKAATARGGFVDVMTRIITTATYSIPSYIFGLWMILLFFDTGFTVWPSDPTSVEVLRYSILPIAVVIMIYTGFQFRLVRAHMLEIMNENYIRTARAKGLAEREVIYKHALKNALPFFVTTVAVTFPIAFSGIAALEQVFQIPGIGKQMINAANNFDWPVLIGITAVFTIINGIILGVTDLVVFFLSPKQRYGYRGLHNN